MKGERKRAKRKRAKRKSRNSGFLGQISRLLGNAPRSAVLHLPGASEVGRVDTYCAMTLMLIRPPGAAPRRPGVPGASRLHAGPQIPHQLPPQVHFSFLFLSSSNHFFLLFLPRSGEILGHLFGLFGGVFLFFSISEFRRFEFLSTLKWRTLMLMLFLGRELKVNLRGSESSIAEGPAGRRGGGRPAAGGGHRPPSKEMNFF